VRTTSFSITIAASILLISNGMWMLISPQGWFAATPIVWRTGVPNDHFIRDVGWTCASIGGLLLWGSAAQKFRAPSFALAFVWLIGHALIHLCEAATGLCSARQLVAEIPQAMGPIFLIVITFGLTRIAGRSAA